VSVVRKVFRLSFGERGVRRDVADEIALHLELRTQEFIQQGYDPAEARQAAIAAFGDVRAVERQCRRIRRRRVRARERLEFLHDLAQDVRFAVRSLRKSPGFTLAILVTLALGIGANTAIFSLINGVLIQPLPFDGGDRLVTLHQPAYGAGVEDAGFSPVELADYRSGVKSLDGLVEYHSMWFILLGLEDPQHVRTGVVSADFFDLFGVEPLHGRTFLPGEDQPGAEPVLILSYDYWRRAFGGDPNVIGRRLEMNDRIHTVVGVLPAIPQYPDANDVYMPVAACPFRGGEAWSTERQARGLAAFGRLRPGVPAERADREVADVAGRLHVDHVAAYEPRDGFGTSVVSLREELVEQARPRLLVLLGMAGFLLLIVCANVVNLTLARLIRRDREIAIRTALGARRRRLFQQLLTEGTVLALAGGALGLLLAVGGLDLLVAFVARFTPRAAEIRVDGAVLLFTLGVSLVTGLLLALLPALPARTSLVDDLKDGAGVVVIGRGRLRLRSVLVASQLAISFVLLIGTGLLIRSFVRLQQVDAGFDPERVLTGVVMLNWSKYWTVAESRKFALELEHRLRGEAGVVSAAVGSTIPLSDQQPNPLEIRVRGSDRPVVADPGVDYRPASPEYFRTLGIPLLRGRAFTDLDGPNSPPVVVVSRTLAERYFGTEKALGGQLCWGLCDVWYTIVGVVGDVKQRGLDREVSADLYVPYARSGFRGVRVLLRTRADPATMAERLRETVRDIDPEQPVTEVRTLSEVRDEALASSRLTMLLMTLFAAVALAITAAGIGGVIAYTVSQRTPELGLRMALGANRWNVVWLVTRQAMLLVAVGLALGVPAALVAVRFLAGLLFEIPPTDPLTFVAVTLLVVGVAAAACLLPTRRATAIDPMAALRTE